MIVCWIEFSVIFYNKIMIYKFQNIETKNPLQIKQYIYIMFSISNWI